MSSLTLKETVWWHIGTIAMMLNLILCIIFAIITKLGDKAQQKRLDSRSRSPGGRSPKPKDKQAFMAYFIYSFAALCAVQCFLCHYSMIWYQSSAYFFCRWGAPVCVVLFFSAKSCLYGFFLERAKLAQGLLVVFPQWLFKYVIPIYIFLYWLIWSICIMVFFKGAPNETVTSCVMETYLPWILTIGAFVDVFNTILFLFLFLYPLRKAYISSKSAFDHNLAKKRKFIHMMWFNVVLSTICTASSFIYLFVLPSTGNYLWFGGQIDMMINSICVFFMLASNRRYANMICNEYFGCLCYDWCICAKEYVKHKQYQKVETDTTTNIEIGNVRQETNTSIEC